MSTTTYFYDGQIRRYLLQIIRLLSNFAVRHSDGTLVRVPVMYGDPDRQAASVINQNSENSVLSAPRIAVYMSDLELDVNRLADSSFVSKVHVRERDYDELAHQYVSSSNKAFTVERLMPTPYRLTVKVDIWSTSNDQKLQILEQLLMLFNPSLEIQTNDNYLDWTSLSVVDLIQTTLSSRSIPVGTADAIDIATLTLQTPIWISPPAKVKKLGVITRVISSIYLDKSNPYGGYVEGLGVDPEAYTVTPAGPVIARFDSNFRYNIEVVGNTVKLIGLEDSVLPSWESVISKSAGGKVTSGISKILLTQPSNTVVGFISLNPLDQSVLSVNWDQDTYPSNSQIASSSRTSQGTFDAIIDPTTVGPVNSTLPVLEAGRRYLIIANLGSGVTESVVNDTDSIQIISTSVLASKVSDHRITVNGVEVGSTSKVSADGFYTIILDTFADVNSEITYTLFTTETGPTAWKNADGTDFVAEENDVIEWDGTSWRVVFSARDNTDQIVYLTNIFTNTQYSWNGVYWGKSFEGVYRSGEWSLELQ